MADVNRPLVGHPAIDVSMAKKCAIAVIALISTTAIAEKLQDNLWSLPYGDNKEKFSFSLFPIFFTLLLSAAGSACILIFTKGPLIPVSAMHTYCGVSVSGIVANVCRHGAVIYASYAVRTLFSCATTIPVMIWGLIIRQRIYNLLEYLFALLVSVASSVFVLFPVTTDATTYAVGREGTLWGVFLLTVYLGFDSFMSTYQELLFKAYPMNVFNQLFYVSLVSCFLSLAGLILQSHFVPAVLFMVSYPKSFFDMLLISFVGTGSQFLTFYTIKIFGARTLSLIMTVRQLVSILVSYIWSSQPLSWEQWLGTAVMVGAIILDNIYGSSEPEPEPLPEPETEPLPETETETEPETDRDRDRDRDRGLGREGWGGLKVSSCKDIRTLATVNRVVKRYDSFFVSP